MNLILRSLVNIVVVAVALFSVFGFLATFEPLEPSQQWIWRIVYTALFSAALLVLFVINKPKRGRSKSKPSSYS